MKRLRAGFDVREKAAAISAVILAWLGLNVAFAFLVNVPRAQRVTATLEASDRAKALASSREDDVERLQQDFDRVMEGRQKLELFYGDVLSTKQERLIEFQKEIREIARRYNINLDTISYPREEFKKDKVTKFTATMPLTGSYENLRDFMQTIERSENFIVIEAIQLANAKEGGIVLSLAIQLCTYFVDPDIQDDAPRAPKRS